MKKKMIGINIWELCCSLTVCYEHENYKDKWWKDTKSKVKFKTWKRKNQNDNRTTKIKTMKSARLGYVDK